MSNLRSSRRRLWRRTFDNGDFKRRPPRSWRLYIEFHKQTRAEPVPVLIAKS